jgi:hypothetical protein
MVGNLGPIVFTTGDHKILTFYDLGFSLSPRLGTHEPAMRAPKMEFVGPGQLEMSFSMNLNVQQGVDARKQCDELAELAQRGEVLAFFIGERPFGNFLIAGLSGGYKTIDGAGGIWNGSVQITIKEYGDNENVDDTAGAGAN